MPTKRRVYERTPEDADGFSYRLLPEAELDAFNASVFGIGDIGAEAQYVHVLAAIYDLQGFTAFCNQIDSHLIIPEFLEEFVTWIVRATKEEALAGVEDGIAKLWAPLPYFTKFLGDGMLFLWETTEFQGTNTFSNLTRGIRNVLTRYHSEFLPTTRQKIVNPPLDLRCGVARGQVMSIGNGIDYVGSCINVASRLQKLASLRFALSRRGLNLSARAKESLLLRKVDLRGIGEELIYVEAAEFETLTPAEQALFREV